MLLKVDSLLSGGASTHDINLIKEDVAMFKDDTSDWNVFHYAAHHNSDSILEKLIEFLRGKFKKLRWCHFVITNEFGSVGSECWSE